MAGLTRAWQILLKGLGETRSAPVPIQAAEMTLVRLAYAASLPTPAEAIKAWKAEADPQAGPEPGDQRGDPRGDEDRDEREYGAGEQGPALQPPHRSEGRGREGVLAVQAAQPFQPSAPPASPSRPMAAPQPAGPAPRMAAQGTAAVASARPDSDDPDDAVGPVEEADGGWQDGRDPDSFEAVVALVGAHREGLLQAKLMSAVHLVHFEPGRIEMRLADSAPDDLPRQLSRFLNENTSRRWLVTVSRSAGEATLVEQREAAAAAQLARVAGHPVVQAVLEVFPGATIAVVRDLEVQLEPADNGEIEEEP